MAKRRLKAKDYPLVCDACVEIDNGGTLRFREKALVRWLADRMTDAHDYHWMKRRDDSAPCADLNKMAVAFQTGEFPLDEYQQFYRDMGYSLCGFEEIFETEAFCIHGRAAEEGKNGPADRSPA